MNARWQRLEALFEQAIELPAAERDAFVASQDLDDELRRELTAMLAADDSSPESGLTRRFGDAIATAADIPTPGQLIGRYRLKREIGSGGAGIVFLAERADDQFHQNVAIKVIRGVATGDAVRQLRHERQILAGFEHPGIARLFDGGETERGQPYLVMEWIEGAPITDAVAKRNLDLRERLRLVREVALAVHYAHQRLVIHRDIKPGNVMLREDGRPVLLDFGIAKLLDAKAAATAHMTQPWFTPAYASPEQRRGATASTATDVYALGLLMYELLVDQRPLVGADGSLAAPSTVAPAHRRATIRGDLDRIVAYATAIEPQDRYPSADAFARDIERYLAGLPVRAAPDRATYRLRKFVRRHPVGVAAAILVTAMAAFFTWRLADERNRAVVAERTAEQEAAASQAVTRYLVGLFREADPAAGRRSLTPSELIDRGVERLAQDAAIEPASRARLLGAIGDIYQNIGLPQKSSDALSDAVKFAREAGARDTLAEALRALGSALDERGQAEEAAAAFGEAATMYRAMGDRGTAAMTIAQQGLAQSHIGDYAAAEKSLVAANEELARIEGPDAPMTLLTTAYRTEVMRETGREEEARRLLEAALPKLERQLPANHPDLLEFYGYYANLLLQLDDTERAQQVFEKMLEYRREMLESDRSPLGFVYNGLGTLYYQQGRTREAAEQFAAALAIGEHTLGAQDPSLAIDLNNVASLYEEMGDYARGEPLIRRAVAIMENAEADRRVLYAQYRQNLGRMLMLSGQSEEALRWLSADIPEDEVGDGWAMQRARQAFHLAEWHRRYGNPTDAQRFLDAVERRIDDLGGRDGPRYGSVLRTRALLALARGDRRSARNDLERARTLLAGGRGETYIGVGEIDLDLAEIAQADGRLDEARKLFAQAVPVIEAVAVETSPQRERIARLRPHLG